MIAQKRFEYHNNKSIVEAILKNPQITITDIVASVGMSMSGVQYTIDNLKTKNALKREGVTKKAHG